MKISTKYRNKTEHLSEEEIKNLKSEYYAGENVNNLVEKYKMNVPGSSLYTSFPFVLKEGLNCRHCNSNMYFIPPSKNAQNRKEYYCTICKHIENTHACDCIQCMRQQHEVQQKLEVERLLQRKKKKENILKVREYTNSPSLHGLTIKEKAYLGALLRVSLNKKYLLISMDYSLFHNLAPTHEYRELIVAELLEQNIITAYTPSRNISDQIAKDLLGEMHYDICISDVNRNKEELIEYLMYPDKVFASKSSGAIILLKEIQIYEAVEYMKLTLQQFELPTFEPEQRYRILFIKVLEQYSQGQLFNFLYSVIRNQAAYRKSGNQGYIPISNYIYKQLSDRYEQARTKNWNIINFRRSWQGDQTELSKLVSNRLLDLGESSFYQVIT